MKLNLRVWRQKNAEDFGRIEKYQIDGVSKDMSFLEMMDILNDQIELEGGEAIAFEHDCREGICGSCSMVINGRPHGPDTGTTACQLHMRRFKDGDTITVEPFRAKAFPVLKDLVVDRGAFDRIIQAGGYVSVNTGAPQDANALPVDKTQADAAFAAAECIGCGACVAACPNASAMLFVSSKITHDGEVIAGARTLPTSAVWGDYSYMLRDAAKGKLSAIPSLIDEDIVTDEVWECTRLVVADSVKSMRDRIAVLGQIVDGLIDIAQPRGGQTLMSLSNLWLHRALNKLGHATDLWCEPYVNSDDGHKYAVMAMPVPQLPEFQPIPVPAATHVPQVGMVHAPAVA